MPDHVKNYASIQSVYTIAFESAEMRENLCLVTSFPDGPFIEMYSFLLFDIFYHQASLFIYLRNLFF